MKVVNIFCWVETGVPGGKPPGGEAAYNPPPLLSGLGSGSGSGSQAHLRSQFRKPRIVETRALQCGVHQDLLALPSLCLLLPVLRSLLVKGVLVGDRRTLFTRRRGRAQDWSSPASSGSSAARSSVRTILLLLPVFGPRPGKVRWTAGSGG